MWIDEQFRTTTKKTCCKHSPVVIALYFVQPILAVHAALRHRQRLQIRHQQIDRRLQFLIVQWLHLFQHKFRHQFAIPFHFRHALHSTIQLSPNRRCLLICTVQLQENIDDLFHFWIIAITINALNKIWCSNFFTPNICWNISNSCSLAKIISLFSCCCMRAGLLLSSSPLPFRIQSNLAIHDVNTVSLLSPSISGNDRTRFSILLRNTWKQNV